MWFKVIKEDDLCCANGRGALLNMLHDMYSVSTEGQKDPAVIMELAMMLRWLDETIKELPCESDGSETSLRDLMEEMAKPNSKFFQGELATKAAPIVSKILQEWLNCRRKYE